MKRIFILLCLPISLYSQVISTYVTGAGDPGHLVFDNIGNLYYTDGLSNKIMKYDTFGILSVYAGTGTAGFSGDGGPATDATMDGPYGITIDTANNIYFGDNNSRIRRIDAHTGIITPFCGNGIPVSSSDGVPASSASIMGCGALHTDNLGNIYFTETNKIRKINISGILSTVVGTGIAGHSGDGGPATAAQVMVSDFALGKFGEIFVEDHFYVLRKVNSAGIINHFAGDSCCYWYTGDNIPATGAYYDAPFLQTDNRGMLYLCEDNRVRMIDDSDIIHTVAGTGVAGYSGDGGNPDTAKLNRPTGIAFDNCNNFYFGEANNAIVRKVTNDSCIGVTVVTPRVKKQKSELFLHPNPVTTTLNIAGGKINSITISNEIGQIVYIEAVINKEQVEIDVSMLKRGLYFVNINGVWHGKFLKE